MSLVLIGLKEWSYFMWLTMENFMFTEINGFALCCLDLYLICLEIIIIGKIITHGDVCIVGAFITSTGGRQWR